MIKFIKAKKNKYHTPNWWDNLLSFIPDIRPSFLTPIILRSNRLQISILNIPSQCPFERAIEAILWGKSYLVMYVPPLCKLNPFFNYLMGLKWEVYNARQVERSLIKLGVNLETLEQSEVPIDDVFSLLKSKVD